MEGPIMTEQPQDGRKMLAEIATRYARGHGLQPREILWEEIGDEVFLLVATAEHSVRIPFSSDEIAALDEEAVTRSAKNKIRDKFAGLSI
jgi:hypothetical protein